MKNVKKLLRLSMKTTMITSCLTLLSSAVVFAEKFEIRIPDKMQAGTIIEYDSSSNMVILKAGKEIEKFSNQTMELKDHPPLDLNKLKNEEELIKQIKEFSKNLNVVKLEYPVVQPGMKVYYDDEGYVKEIMYPEHQSIAPHINSQVSPPTKVLKIGTRAEPNVYSYGRNNNKITITGTSSGQVLGEGRFTNFTDAMGDSSNYLKKGDVATKNTIDNPLYNTVLDARNTENNIFSNVYKADNGQLPDAVLDVWKTGVELFGMNWSSSLSFSGRYYYAF
ncbi:hypothetical protein [Paenibacillus sp. RC84]|uniref:hypothetical protein n=1 Tax=Paenibacillus sp. RC84 TaxID=3156252 RepID=UPI003518C079